MGEFIPLGTTLLRVTRTPISLISSPFPCPFPLFFSVPLEQSRLPPWRRNHCSDTKVCRWEILSINPRKNFIPFTQSLSGLPNRFLFVDLTQLHFQVTRVTMRYGGQSSVNDKPPYCPSTRFVYRCNLRFRTFQHVHTSRSFSVRSSMSKPLQNV